MIKQKLIPLATYNNQHSKRELDLISQINDLKSELMTAKARIATYKDMIANDLPF